MTSSKKPALTMGNLDSALPTPTKKLITLEQTGTKRQPLARTNLCELQGLHHSAKAQSETTFRFDTNNKLGVVRGFGFSSTNKLHLQSSQKASGDPKQSAGNATEPARRANTFTGEACSSLQPHIRTIDFTGAEHDSGATSALLKPEAAGKSKKRKMLKLGSFSDNDEPIICHPENSIDNFSPLHPKHKVY